MLALHRHLLRLGLHLHYQPLRSQLLELRHRQRRKVRHRHHQRRLDQLLLERRHRQRRMG